MQYRKFGSTGWDVSEVSFGGWQLGGHWGGVDDENSLEALRTAYESGVNFVDTAELYGEGHSEEVIGESLRRWDGDRIYVATKVRPVRPPNPADDDPQMRGRYPGWYLRESVEGSLRRLGVERLDLLQLHHWCPSGVYELDWLETLNQLRLEGKIDKIGVSVRDYRPDETVPLVELGLIDSIQVIFNMFEQTPMNALFPAAEATGTAVIVRVALDSGSLSGKWTEDTYANWDEGSQQRDMFRGDRFAETLKRVNALKADVAPYYDDLAEAALRFTLSESAVSTVIAGMSSARNVLRNVAVSDGAAFPAELKAALADHAWVRNYYV
jgi:aryl-alcohol dehydrogenase-like predicted oxidoreductase